HEPVEVAVIGQQLRPEGRMLLDERVDDAADRFAPDLERLHATDIRPEHGRDEDRAHARASGETLPDSPVVVIRNGASSPTPAVGSGLPALRASTAASEQTGQFGSRRSWSSVNSVSSASNSTSRPASVVPIPSSTLRASLVWSRPKMPGTTPSTPATEQPGASSGGGG